MRPGKLVLLLSLIVTLQRQVTAQVIGGIGSSTPTAIPTIMAPATVRELDSLRGEIGNKSWITHIVADAYEPIIYVYDAGTRTIKSYDWSIDQILSEFTLPGDSHLVSISLAKRHLVLSTGREIYFLLINSRGLLQARHVIQAKADSVVVTQAGFALSRSVDENKRDLLSLWDVSTGSFISTTRVSYFLPRRVNYPIRTDSTGTVFALLPLSDDNAIKFFQISNGPPYTLFDQASIPQGSFACSVDDVSIDGPTMLVRHVCGTAKVNSDGRIAKETSDYVGPFLGFNKISGRYISNCKHYDALCEFNKDLQLQRKTPYLAVNSQAPVPFMAAQTGPPAISSDGHHMFVITGYVRWNGTSTIQTQAVQQISDPGVPWPHLASPHFTPTQAEAVQSTPEATIVPTTSLPVTPAPSQDSEDASEMEPVPTTRPAIPTVLTASVPSPVQSRVQIVVPTRIEVRKDTKFKIVLTAIMDDKNSLAWSAAHLPQSTSLRKDTIRGKIKYPGSYKVILTIWNGKREKVAQKRVTLVVK